MLHPILWCLLLLKLLPTHSLAAHHTLRYTQISALKVGGCGGGNDSP